MCGACSTWIFRTSAAAVAASAFTCHECGPLWEDARDSTDFMKVSAASRAAPNENPLRLEVGVLDRQGEELSVQGAVLREPLLELREQPGLLGVGEAVEDGRERSGVTLDRELRCVGLPCALRGALVRVRHHGAVRGVLGLGEVYEQIGRQVARVGQAFEARFGPAGDCGGHRDGEESRRGHWRRRGPWPS